MKTFNSEITVKIPYAPIKALDFEDAEDVVVRLFEDEYPDLVVFDYKISELKEIKEIK